MMPAQPNAAPNPQQRTPQQVFEMTKRLLAMGDEHDAAQHAALLKSHFPDQTPILGVHGLAMAAVGAHELAVDDLARCADDSIKSLNEGEAENPNRPRIADQAIRMLTQLARSREAMGQPAEADAALDRALALDPEAPEPVRARIEILAARAETAAAQSLLNEANELGLEELPAALAAAAIALAKPDAARDECHVLAQRLRALTDRVGLDASTQKLVLRRAAALFDRAGETDEAFRAANRAANFTRGNYDAAAHARATNAVIAGWTADAMKKIARPDRDDAARVFVFGAPHAGGEELARALTAHPDIACTGHAELLTAAAARKAGAKPTPYRPILPTCQGLRRDQLDAVANIYSKNAAAFALPKDRAVTADPTTVHAHMLGLAALAMPGSKFVFVKRDPRQNLLSCFFNGVPGHHPYTKELPTTAAFLRDVDRTIDHWNAVFADLGITVVNTTHAALKADPAAETARIIATLGLAPASVAGPRFPAEPADHADRYAKRIDPVAALLPSGA